MIGTTVSHYRIIEKLGEGGMGVVYRAEDTKLQRLVGLKFLRTDLTRDTHAKERFVQEARAASGLDHPNICTIYEIDETDAGELFISMACYEGETVMDRIRRGPLEIADAVDIALQVAAGLGKAHAKGIVHRDIKPGNIFLTREGPAKILDFGLAKLADQTRLTRIGGTVGTVSYMSPEQARGRKIDPRTDVWSLGVVLYEMVSGQRPFRGEREQAVLYSICQEPPEPVAALRDDIPQELAGIIARCLRKDPDERYRTAGELSDELAALQGSISRGETTPASVPTVTVVRRPRGIVRRTLVRVAVVVGILGVATWYGIEHVIPPPLPELRYLAILPPAGSDDSEERAFVDGLAEYLTFRLSQLEKYDDSFRVEPGAYVRSLGVATADDARSVFGATLALASTIERSGNEVSAHFSLLDTASGRSIRGLEFPGSLGNVVALQNDIVVGLTELLGAGSTEAVRRELSVGGTTVPAALSAYVTGLGHVIWPRGEDEGHIRAAIGFFEEARAADPGYVLALAALGDAHWRLCRTTADPACVGNATIALERAVALDDRLAGPHVTLGEISAHGKRYEEAEAQFLRALEIDPLHLGARNKLAENYEDDGEGEKAEIEYRRAIELRPRRWIGHNNLGYFYQDQKEYANAARKFQRVIELVPENTTGYTNLAAIYWYQRRYDLAYETLKRTIDLERDYVDYLNFGTIFFYTTKYADAADMYEEARALDDSDYRVWGYLGAAYWWVPGEREHAAEVYQEAVRMGEELRRTRPDDAMLLCFLAGYYACLEDTTAAIDLTEQALELDQDNATVLFQSGHTYEIVGDRENALKWIGRALVGGFDRKQCEETPRLRGLVGDNRYTDLVASIPN